MDKVFIITVSIAPLLDHAWSHFSQSSTTGTRTFLSSAIRCYSESVQTNGSTGLLVYKVDDIPQAPGIGPIRRCPLPMAQQHRPFFFRVALAPSDNVPGQMIHVECVQIVCLRYRSYIRLPVHTDYHPLLTWPRHSE
ncbi:hypothetical protein HD554DRAFT_868484 [Boletus coccyginus]|nr:hypothetical protein HD554DRAFT_868484 [Boletus coccyginus]